MVNYSFYWIELFPLKNKRSSEVVKILKIIFATYGITKIVVPDNISFAYLEFNNFADKWNLKFSFSSPGYSRSNSKAEKM